MDNTETFIKRVNEMFGSDKFLFHKTIYVNSLTKVVITCIKHGDFQVSPTDILRKRGDGHGCKKCSGEKMSKLKLKKNEVFIEELTEIYGNSYEYSKVLYKGRKEKVDVFCNICSRHFKKEPYRLLKGVGCPHCAKNKRTKTKEYFISESKKIHGIKYDYAELEYGTMVTKVKLTCNSCGHDFMVKASHHLHNGSGCPLCAKRKCFKKSDWVNKPINSVSFESYKLYVMIAHCRKTGESFVKIGITRNSIKDRFHANKNITRDFPYFYEIVEIIDSEDGEYIWDLEKTLHKKFKSEKYIPKKIFGGRHECFNIESLKEIQEEVRLIKED